MKIYNRIGYWMIGLSMMGLYNASSHAEDSAPATASQELAKDFASPPTSARPWCYWWWLKGAASKEGITRDFEEMRKQGIGGALLFDAGEAGPEAPRGPKFMSDEWRELYKHAVREADRCGIVLTVNLCSGWNAGGPWVTNEHAAKKLVSSETSAKGPGRATIVLPKPQETLEFYRDITVLAAPVDETAAAAITDSSQPQKLSDNKTKPPQWIWKRQQAVELSKFMDENGRLEWEVPNGTWKILRIGYTLHGAKIKCVGGGPSGLEIDPMSASAMDAHYAETGAKLIADAGPLVGKALQYFHIDSWELGQPTWTPRLREEFLKRRGYDPLVCLPAVLGYTVNDAAETKRFIQDYRRTVADLVAENYYGRLEELSVKGGLRGTHPESGGPFFSQWIDALQCLGKTAIPMGEYWRRSSEPDGPLEAAHNPSLKEAACAAHIYGKPLCQAEAFTSMRACDWTAEPWIFKDIGDAAFCEGLTRNVLCFWVHQSRVDAKPGFQWAHVGTHFDSNVTWWPLADGWLTYLSRCQHMLRQGLFVADFAYLQNESIPGFLAKRPEQQPARPAGFDYDVLNAEVLLTRASAKHGRLVLPDGMSYRYLVLPAFLSPATLKKVNELAEAGVPVIGPAALAAAVPKMRQGSLDAIIQADGQRPDIEFRNPTPKSRFDWIHRHDGGREIYFISNQGMNDATANIAFRVSGKNPELWDAVTGTIRDLAVYKKTEDGRTEIPMTFAPRQSWFVVFDDKTPDVTASDTGTNFPAPKPVMELTGAWEVEFDKPWFYPDAGADGKVHFEHLMDWTQRPEEAVKHYSGTALYKKTFDYTPSGTTSAPRFLNLGTVKNVARVRLNGRDLGTVWTAPWQVDISGALKPGANELEIQVANLWPNRLIGDATLPQEQRRTVTNVRTYDTQKTPYYGCKKCGARKKSGKPTELLPSGLFGPVKLEAVEKQQ